jgi:signal transduction histidine kinase/CheY-like chemotaxis protein
MKTKSYISGFLIFSLFAMATILFMPNHGYSQSLLENKTKADLLLKEANFLLKTNPEKAILPIKKAQFLYSNENLHAQQINCILSLAEVHIRLSDYTKAYSLLTNAASLSLEHNLVQQNINALSLLGRVSAYLNDVERAISFNRDGIELAKQNNLPKEIISLSANIAYIEIYYQQKYTDENYKIIKKLYGLSQKNITDTLMLMTALNYMGGAEFWINKKNIYASEFLKRSIEVADKSNDFFRESLLLNNLGEIYFLSGSIKKAEEIFLKSLQIAKSINSKLLIYNCYKFLSKCAENQNQLKNALDYYKIYMDVKSEVLNEDMVRKTREYYSLYKGEKKGREEDRKKAERILLETENQAKFQKLIWTFTTVSIILIFIIVLLGLNRKSLRDSLDKKKTIEEQNKSLLVLNKNLWDQKKFADEANREAETAIQSKIDFLSIITHELRTPLNAVIGTVQLLQEENPTTQQQRGLDILKFSSDNLLNLVNDILDFNKIEAGKVELESNPFSLSGLLVNIKNSLQFKADENGIELKLKIDKNLPSYFLGDKLRLGQVFYNLISNAIKFTESGFVEIEIRYYPNKLEGNILASIKDTGIGIAEEKQKGIFDFFSQADPSIVRNFGGSGLGLTISKNLLKLMDSSIQLESTLGKGSKFYFSLTLPISDSLENTDDNGEKNSEQFSFTEYCILFVEDVEFNQIVAERFFNKWNLKYDIAQTGSEAFDLTKSKKYDLILMDLNLPDMSGFEATGLIKENSLNSDTMIIALTAYTYSEISDKIVEFGLNGFLQKPFIAVDMRNSLFHWLRKSKPNKMIS